MAELAEFLASFALSQADKDAARKQALMMAGLGLLGAKKGREAEAMGRAGLLGMDAYQQGLTGAQQGKVDQYKMAEVWRKQKEAEEAAKAQAADVAAVEQAKQSPWQAAAPWLSATGPVPKDSDAERYQRMALATKNPANAKIYGELADKIAEKFGAPTVGMVGGKPSYARFGDKGGSQIVPGIVPPPDSQIVDLGGQKRVIDKLTTAPGTTFDVTMDPAQIAANKIAQGQLGVAQGNLGVSQANLAQRKAEHDAKVAADKAAGSAGGADKATDPQLAARGFLHRMRGAEEIISGIEAGGYTPSFGTAYVEGMKRVPIIGGTAGGLASMARNAVSPEAGNYAQAQDDWIRAKLRKESGAVISPEEMEGERRTYFPQAGDSDALIKQKRLARKRAEEQMSIQAKESIMQRPGASGGWSITPVN